MNFPIWDVPLMGGGLLIGFVSILHVFVAHFAIGGGLFLVLTEHKAYRENDMRILEYVKRHSLFFLLVTIVFGAITGVGIWFTISVVSPSATSALIHTFVFAWAIEWVFFFVEVTAAFIYYYTWGKLDRATHLVVGWIYFISGWLSLFVINGILCFMLTPGEWLHTASFWDAFFNPTFWPSLVMRTVVALALAGLYALLTASMIKTDEVRANLVKYSTRWLFPAFFVLPIAGIWYNIVLPPLARDISMGGAPAVTVFAGLTILLSVLIFVFAYFYPYRQPEKFPAPAAAMFLLLGLMVTGVTEWVREAVRKPYIIYDYMYSNSVLVAHKNDYYAEGILKFAKWVTVKEVTEANLLEAGATLFRLQCQSCHTLHGYNGIALMVKGWDEEFIDHQLDNLDQLKGFMPPFMGSVDERHALARWLVGLNRRGAASIELTEPPARPATAAEETEHDR